MLHAVKPAWDILYLCQTNNADCRVDVVVLQVWGSNFQKNNVC